MLKSRYTPTENGYEINGSSEVFNRTLYGSHKNDDKSARFFTFAGDAPQFLGASTDWEKDLFSFYSKCGTLTSGLALTPDQRVGFFYSDDIDISSRWFHNSEDIRAEFKKGWMEYELSQMSPWFPDVKVNIEAYPLLPDDGFLIHYKIATDQRVYFVAGFGGITDYIARFEYKDEKKRYFCAEDCQNNTVKLGKNNALISHPNGCSMRIAATFDCNFELGSAKSLQTPYPSSFLGSKPENNDDNVVKISTTIAPGKELDGYIIVLYNSDEKTLENWLSIKNPDKYVKEQIYLKHACINAKTPDNSFDLTIAPTVIALDSSFHKNSFHHGAFGYHSPFLGWRNWYAPTCLGWNDRVESTVSAHLAQIIKPSDKKERVWFDGENPREGDGPSQYHSIENSYGYLPYFLGKEEAYYNMQECAFDMIMHHIEWSGNLDIARKFFNEFCAMLDWEERIFDYDNDGLYQNFLNTWISDGHSYNGAGCAQSSAYNYRANLIMAKIAKKLQLPNKVFLDRANKIKQAINDKLWLSDKGIIAESIDTIGNRLIHPEPELSTTYLAIDCDVVDDFQAYTMLKYTENNVKSIETPVRKGRLSYCSNWLPKKYSTYGIFPAENAHLALTYFKLGLKESGKKLLDGIIDCYFMGRNPGMAAHVQSSRCTSDLADLDFTDVSSTYLRLVIEGLYGIRINSLDERIDIAPNFPIDWEKADLSLADISLHYNKKGNDETFDVYCDRTETKHFKIPMISTSVDTVIINGKAVSYTVSPSPNNSYINISTDIVGHVQLRVIHGNGNIPAIKYSALTFAKNQLAFQISDGDIIDVLDINRALENIETIDNTVYATAKNVLGDHTLFIRVKKDEYDAYLAADYKIIEKKTEKPDYSADFEPIDIKKFFNCNMTEVHNQKFMSPRPKGYSIGVFPNGRYAWEWNHRGHNLLYVDDGFLRSANGKIHTASGIPFLTPSENENLACVSTWDNFPTEISIPLKGKAKEIAVLFISTTNAMQTGVENAKISVEYDDNNSDSISLVYPINIDDWLVPALQKENEYFYFNDYNHATVQRIPLNPNKNLSCLKIKAVANEVILGVLGVSIGR